MTVLTILLVMLILLILKGFFSGSEIGFVSADRVKLRLRASHGSKGARLAQNLLRAPAKLLTTTLLGTNFTTIALATLGTLLMVDLFGDQGELIAVLVFTPVFMILGEIVPKSIFQEKANRLVPLSAYPLSILQVLLAPLVWLFSTVAQLTARLFGGGNDEALQTRDLFESAVKSAEKSAMDAAFAKGQVRNVLRVAQLTAGEAMWPLEGVKIFEVTTAMPEIAEYCLATEHDLIPLRDPAVDKITHFARLHPWDLLDPNIKERNLIEFLTPMQMVSEDKPVSEIMEELHARPDLVVMVPDNNVCAGILTLDLLVRLTLGVEAASY